MAFYMIKTEDRNEYQSINLCVKNKETALAVAEFVCKAMHGSCKSFDCGEDVARYNRADRKDGERLGEVTVTELAVVG